MLMAMSMSAMMDPGPSLVGTTYVGMGTVSKTVVNGGSVSIALPVGLLQNDPMLLITGKSNSSTMSTPAGWTAVGTSPGGLDVFSKYAGSSEAAPSIAASAGGITGVILAWRNADPVTMVDTSAQATPASLTAFPTITTTVANCPVVLCATGNNLGSFALGAAGNLTGYTEIVDEQNDGALDSTLGVALATMVSAGSIGAPAVTPTGLGASTFGSMAIAIRPT